MTRVDGPVERQKFYFQFITTPTADTPGTTLLLHFNNKRYLFGQIAEGTQRACVQRGVGLRKVRNLFLTGETTWANMGGLIGMILTMADIQADEKEWEGSNRRPRLNIHGGPKLTHAMACARRFVFRTGMPLSLHEAKVNTAGHQPNYSDDNVNVWTLAVQPEVEDQTSNLANQSVTEPTTADEEQSIRQKTVHDMFDSDWRLDKLHESRFDQVHLPAMIYSRDPTTKQLSHVMCTTMADAPHLSPESTVLVRSPWPASTVHALPSANNLPSSVAMSYVVKGRAQRGKFLPERARELGVTPGRDFAVLAAGGTLTLPSGETITSEMVLEPPELGRGAAIFDLPLAKFTSNLSQQIEHLREAGVLAGIEVMVWILGPGVHASTSFQQLLASFGDVKHYLSSTDTHANYLAQDSSAASATRLAAIRPECFLEPQHCNAVIPTNSTEHRVSLAPSELAQRGLLLEIAPKLQIKTDDVPGHVAIDNIRATCKTQLRDLIPGAADRDVGRLYDDVEIITLGTGSAVPSKYRNVSATLVRIPGLGCHLFDCGESTLGQLRRAFTASEFEEILIELRMIWISHLHADHHLGTLSLIVARNELLDRKGITAKPLYIVSEPNMSDFLHDYGSVQASRNCVLLSVLNSQLTIDGRATVLDSTGLPLRALRTCRVSHCQGAQAITAIFSNGFRFSYSGDCRPSQTFAKMGLDSDVLVHEATFDDGKEGDAMAKKHCTTGEALGVGHTMRAKNVVLTHFSQRYQKIPVLKNIKFGDSINFEESGEGDEVEDPTVQSMPLVGEAPAESFASEGSGNGISGLMQAATSGTMNICVAFDLMKVNLSQIRDMYKYYPAIERMFEIEQQKSDDRKEANVAANEEKMKLNRAKHKTKTEKPKKSKDMSPRPQSGHSELESNGPLDTPTTRMTTTTSPPRRARKRMLSGQKQNTTTVDSTMSANTVRPAAEDSSIGGTSVQMESMAREQPEEEPEKEEQQQSTPLPPPTLLPTESAPEHETSQSKRRKTLE